MLGAGKRCGALEGAAVMTGLFVLLLAVAGVFLTVVLMKMADDKANTKRRIKKPKEIV